MKPFEPMFLKTYGKLRRKVSAWISPEDRKKAFDSTPSSDDLSVFEAAKPRKARGKYKRDDGQRADRPAKKKAMLCLNEKSFNEENMSDEENTPPSPTNPAPSQKTRGKNRRLSSSKQEAVLCPSETSSYGESIMKPPLPTKRRKTTRSKQVGSVPVFTRRRGRAVSTTSESESETSVPKLQKIQAKAKMDSSVRLPSAGRFITRRRRAASTKPPEAAVSLLNSSDDFTSRPFGSSVNQHASRRHRAPPVFVLSSAENSVNAPRTTEPFREISLNELAENSLGCVPSKPIFCSTPSMPNFNKRRHPKFQSQVASPPSALGSSIGVSNIFQEGPDSLQLPASLSLQKAANLHHNEEQSLDLFSESGGRVCSIDAECHRGDVDGGKSDIESSSVFVSAAGRLEWLIEALKERCLSQPCAVQLQRLNFIPMTQLSSQTSYSSCLELSSPESKVAPPSTKWSQTFGFCSEKSARRSFSITTNKTSDYGPPVPNLDIADSASDDHVANVLKLPELFSGEVNGENLESVICVDDAQNSYEGIMETQSPAARVAPTRLTDEEAKTAKSTICTKECVVQIKKLSLSQLHLQGLEHEHNPEAKAESSDISELNEASLTSKAVVKVKKLSLSEMTDVLQPKDGALKSLTSFSDSSGDDQTSQFSDSECSEDATSLKTASKSVCSNKEVKKSVKGFPNREKGSRAPKQRSPSSDRNGTARKACVSGMSVSRWKNKGAAGAQAFRKKQGTSTAVDCRISELMSKHTNELLAAAVNFSTPLRTNPLNLPSLLTDFTPSKHTWSRLKAALSVHRKSMVQLTPRSVSGSVTCTPLKMRLPDVSQDLFTTPLRTPLPKRLQAQLLHQHSLFFVKVVCEDADLTDAEKVYAECGQQCPLSWEECILPHRMKRCVKIGEGTFGEVFSTTNAAGETVALKVIPLEGSEKVNGEDQKTFGEILPEIIISKELSHLKEKQQNQTHGFIGLNDLHCVQGCYPPEFLKAWDAFDQRKGSENDRPDFFEKDQLFIILEFEFGGVDLENSNGTLASFVVAKSVLHQVTAALAVAEQELHFEHRDLHWGNVLVKATREKTGTFLLDGEAHSMETKGVLVRIIDYSLSRLEIDDLTVSCDISNDEELFMGQGDYQFEIYRLMRQENGNKWSSYHPRTNVLWLHYLCSKLLSMKYKSSGGRGGKNAREELARFYDDVLQYSSATDALQNCPMFW
ncbi:uncharacterized protein haspin isoform X1 [Poecilia latipinna]|uniref:uncharacterized protein haspin isoform X1 n=1 Tax=Poecilia latipinna TaxID=48699 RepID=UPI00072EB9D6|nr:PREDICTED: serine/threonine-protein kinase haspin isoform X1 [Poecilia latipinna]XP_014887803.1 PREDICTED: serine/threonine-protein kinase haspin isoform X1 [Poecilia latipinna]XP_014887804.1 PREDICTED: serine/threonine-protein kinase haspin isoform X1 [Poecilia latipinna]XP_014887805.1 PREDICTED: serine/threonine-protein kinase haspin isoform X1 [Poecilia latipinna]XP_014887806.1 PREDICTED: serine/threonine-protein kinase haspin isoform X1 [Poecilia latipinna]